MKYIVYNTLSTILLKTATLLNALTFYLKTAGLYFNQRVANAMQDIKDYSNTPMVCFMEIIHMLLFVLFMTIAWHQVPFIIDAFFKP